MREMVNNKSTFYQEFEVFSKRTPSAQHFNINSVLLAPNEEMALVMAQENFMRREPVADIWVVNRSKYSRISSRGKTNLQPY